MCKTWAGSACGSALFWFKSDWHQIEKRFFFYSFLRAEPLLLEGWRLLQEPGSFKRSVKTDQIGFKVIPYNWKALGGKQNLTWFFSCNEMKSKRWVPLLEVWGWKYTRAARIVNFFYFFKKTNINFLSCGRKASNNLSKQMQKAHSAYEIVNFLEVIYI